MRLFGGRSGPAAVLAVVALLPTPTPTPDATTLSVPPAVPSVTADRVRAGDAALVHGKGWPKAPCEVRVDELVLSEPECTVDAGTLAARFVVPVDTAPGTYIARACVPRCSRRPRYEAKTVMEVGAAEPSGGSSPSPSQVSRTPTPGDPEAPRRDEGDEPAEVPPWLPAALVGSLGIGVGAWLLRRPRRHNRRWVHDHVGVRPVAPAPAPEVTASGPSPSVQISSRAGETVLTTREVAR
jgi:hypothetical protein